MEADVRKKNLYSSNSLSFFENLRVLLSPTDDLQVKSREVSLQHKATEPRANSANRARSVTTPPFPRMF